MCECVFFTADRFLTTRSQKEHRFVYAFMSLKHNSMLELEVDHPTAATASRPLSCVICTQLTCDITQSTQGHRAGVAVTHGSVQLRGEHSCCSHNSTQASGSCCSGLQTKGRPCNTCTDKQQRERTTFSSLKSNMTQRVSCFFICERQTHKNVQTQYSDPGSAG